MEDDIQYPSLLSNAHITHEGSRPLPPPLPQPQKNMRNITKVGVQDGNSPNMLQENSMITLENEEKIDQPSPSPFHENEDVENPTKND